MLARADVHLAAANAALERATQPFRLLLPEDTATHAASERRILLVHSQPALLATVAKVVSYSLVLSRHQASA
ncbi:MAG TPA: hypothetical protein VHT74_35135 [Acetobacteraceae bacterium]|jgi:cellobiose-specific phosphotransferase system component IIA|nr:hypothetical protein [Acetobacteraceae bacterium]